MHIALTPEQERLREELREYFADLVTPEVRAGARGEPPASSATPTSTRTVIRQIGARRLARASAGPRSTAARTARWWTS